MDLVKLDLKIFAAEGSAIEPGELIPVFHRWIQTSALDDLLIDVADYRHVHEGPAVILLGHDAHYVWDLGEGRPGLLCSRRRETHLSRSGIATLGERLHSLLRDALVAAAKLEAEPRLRGRLRFRTDEILLTANDRLRAPNDEASAALLRPALVGAIEQIYGSGAEVAVSATDRRGRLAFTARDLPHRDLHAVLTEHVAAMTPPDDERRLAAGDRA